MMVPAIPKFSLEKRTDKVLLSRIFAYQIQFVLPPLNIERTAKIINCAAIIEKNVNSIIISPTLFYYEYSLKDYFLK